MVSRSEITSFTALLRARRDFIHKEKVPDRRRTARVVSTWRRIVALMLCTAASAAWMPDTSRQDAAHARAVETSERLREIAVEAERIRSGEILWLARAIYSETKRPEEQELVAWVVRNRVETRYRGNTTYEEAVLDPYQFSAFNPNTTTRAFYMGLDWNSTTRGFQTALAIASKVADADPQERPFSISTRHFYSARSMTNGKVPAWAESRRLVELDRPVDAERFRFYERIA